ncbi:MAG: GPW/gp25 family protein [Pseudomonadota bacterium]|nr:GPW/gp25 family protein [Pseudomonadota bacterium]
MRGMSARTGQAISGDAHLAQSVADILTTPVGTRIMRRDYGSPLPLLVDAPANAATTVRLYGAAATALQRWEPRLTLTRISLWRIDNGQYQLDIDGIRRDLPTRPQARLHIPITH